MFLGIRIPSLKFTTFLPKQPQTKPTAILDALRGGLRCEAVLVELGVSVFCLFFLVLMTTGQALGQVMQQFSLSAWLSG